MGYDPRECHASTRLTLSINVRLLYTRFCATAINAVTSQVRSMSVGLQTHSHTENITGGGGGRTSEKYLTENCGFLNYLSPGDLILADRGSTSLKLWDLVRPV